MQTVKLTNAVGWSRREVLCGAGWVLGAMAFPLRVVRADEVYRPPKEAVEALRASPLVYISPLLADGSESRCHGEVWFFFDEGDVVIATGKDTWKARALGKGRDRARIWVGDFGPVSKAGDRFRSAPSFEARARRETERAVFDRLLAAYGGKYPAEWEKWEPRFEKGYGDGSRVVIRYQPIAP